MVLLLCVVVVGVVVGGVGVVVGGGVVVAVVVGVVAVVAVVVVVVVVAVVVGVVAIGTSDRPAMVSGIPKVVLGPVASQVEQHHAHSTPQASCLAAQRLPCDMIHAISIAGVYCRVIHQDSKDTLTYRIAGVTCPGLNLSPLHPLLETHTAGNTHC